MQNNWQYNKIDMPNDMLGLIEQYEYGLKYRVYEVMNWLVAHDLLDEDTAYVYDVEDVDIQGANSVPQQDHERGS